MLYTITLLTHPGASDLELGRVSRLVAFDLHRLGIAARLRNTTAVTRHGMAMAKRHQVVSAYNST